MQGSAPRAQHARRRLRAAGRDADRGRRLQLPHPLHPRRTGSSASSAATGVCSHDPPHSFGAVNGDTPLKDGGVLVSEIQGSWIDDIAHEREAPLGGAGAGLLPVRPAAPLRRPDPARRLHESRRGDHHEPARHGALALRASVGLGALDHPSLAMMLPNGDIAINDDYNDRVVIVDPTTNRIVWQYGHAGIPRTRPRLPEHAGRDGLRPARSERKAALVARAPSVAARRARPRSSSRPAARAPARLVIGGYPYASVVPGGGRPRRRRPLGDGPVQLHVVRRVGALARTATGPTGSSPARWTRCRWANVARRPGSRPVRAAGRCRRRLAAWWKFGHLALVTRVLPTARFDVAEYNLPGGVRVRLRPARRLAARRHVRVRAARSRR